MKSIKIFKKIRDKIDVLKHKNALIFFKILAFPADKVTDKYYFIVKALILGVPVLRGITHYLIINLIVNQNKEVVLLNRDGRSKQIPLFF